MGKYIEWKNTGCCSGQANGKESGEKRQGGVLSGVLALFLLLSILAVVLLGGIGALAAGLIQVAAWLHITTGLLLRGLLFFIGVFTLLVLMISAAMSIAKRGERS